ncbi:CD109 antigen-like [Ruditapes philippinarum]|uniref:CD109 antigen-like n=1 Tax=Ruditapes philippinarum TaxID=129788 RepID=UPI00295B778E|nr:CD109 antigen-like [Ruditapes philippinarum]XP_060595855.1 CD109 antigen-like [Ruditapes philippinarum]
MTKLCLLGLTLALIWGFAAAQTRDEIVNNVGGYQVERAPTYIIMAPRKIRPNQVFQVYCTILRLEYSEISLRVSVNKDSTEFTEGVLKFDQPGSRIMQMLMPANAQPGSYTIKIEGMLNGGEGGYAFYNETKIDFDAKQASVFIQLSKPIYKQGQTVHFRVVPILPDMMPMYGSLTIYVKDPTGFPVRRWLGLQTNAGGFVSQNFSLSDQPNYGNWSIQVDAYGYEYKKYFQVEEYWDPRFDLNVTTHPYVMDNMDHVRGVLMANITTGKPVMGSADVQITLIPPRDVYPYDQFYAMNAYRDPWDFSIYPRLYKHYDYFKGRIDFEFKRQDILDEVRRTWPSADNLIGYECVFNVTAKDWFFNMTQKGFASTVIFNPNIRVMFIGDNVRTFKPDSIMTVYVAAMYYDGTPVVDNYRRIQITKRYSYLDGGVTGGVENNPDEKQPVDGVAAFDVPIPAGCSSVEVIAKWDYDIRTTQTLKASRYYSPSRSYISVRTSTDTPNVNEFMIFHVKTSHFVPMIYYQIVSQGNILIGEELEMISRHKTFAVALSRQMVPTARIVVYFLQTSPEEMVVDTLNFFVNGTRSNPVKAIINKGKDFTLHSIEINAIAEPGSYVAFAAMPNDLYSKGMNDGLTENNLIDELVSYDEPAKGSYKQLWRLSDTEYEYKFYASTGYGIDANSTFRHAGLLVLSDANIHDIPDMCNWEYERPCFDGTCYHVNKTCDGFMDCLNDGADEQGCTKIDPRFVDNRTMNMIYRVNRNLRFYEDSGFAWQERFVKPDGMVQFRIKPPKFPLTWIINALSVSRDKGLGLMQSPIRYDATRYMYIIVEAPELTIRGEQIGVRVTVFNYWYADDYIEVLVTMRDGENYKFVWVDEMGITSAYAPLTKSGDHQTIVFLEPGESKDIFMPIVPTIVQGEIEFTVDAFCFMERDSVTKKVRIMPDGVLNYYHTPYLIDMIKYGSETIPQLQINIPDQFVVPEVRYHLYVPGSGVAQVSLFGDVVTPGFITYYMNCEDIFRKPYGAGEMNMFNFAYNLLTLKFKKANQQLDPEVLSRALDYLNVGLQRQLSYMKDDGSFKMFRDDENSTSIWLSAFVAKTLHEARFGEWERDLFIPIDLIDKIVVWLCEKQNETGAWYPEGQIYDRKFSSQSQTDQMMYGHPVPLTAYVLIALYKIETDVSGAALSCIDKSRQLASEYLSREAFNTPNREVFHLAVSAYALSLSQQKSRTIFDKLWSLRNQSNEIYFSDSPMPENPSDFINTVRYLLPRTELMNDGYAVQSTAYALMAHIKHNGMGIDTDTKIQRDSMMKWLNHMRNFIGGFASTQDSLTAMEALFEFTQVDPNRNVFETMITMEASSTPTWVETVAMTKTNYTDIAIRYVPQDFVYGSIRVTAQGVGRSMMQLTTTVNVEYRFLLKETQDQTQFFELTSDYIRFTGRNSSVMVMNPCIRWVYLDKSLQSGLTVLEIDVPTGYVVMNHTLRDYVNSGIVPNLKRAEFYYRKVVFYFSHVDNSKTCVNFQADRWYPTANMTIQHRMRVYDYYEPGMHNTTLYSTYNMFNLNICYVCGSYQCPYCPYFNVGTVIKASFTCVALILGFLAKKYALRTS